MPTDGLKDNCPRMGLRNSMLHGRMKDGCPRMGFNLRDITPTDGIEGSVLKDGPRPLSLTFYG